MGRPMVYLARLRACPRVRRGRICRGKEGSDRAVWQRSEIKFRLFADHQRAHGRSTGWAHRPLQGHRWRQVRSGCALPRPTLLYPITWDDKIMEDEIFGPILPILTYKSFDEAMMRMAKTGRPLARSQPLRTVCPPTTRRTITS
jgi:Aldehyde dehydrogenase family